MAAPSPTSGALGVTHSVCSECGRLVPAKVLSDGRDVFLRRFCPGHGETQGLVWRDLDSYLAAQRYVKPAWQPRRLDGDASQPCPDGCGFCSRHEQHLCLPIVEITERCDLRCPVCLVGEGGDWEMPLDGFRDVLERLVEAEGRVNVLTLSGGEPLQHPQLLAFVDEALSLREVVRVSVSTNGLRFLDAPQLLHELKSRDVVVSLQFDGFCDAVYQFLRGEPLRERKLRLLDLLAEADVTTTLTMTAARGVNDDQFGEVLELLFSRPHLVSLMVQPIAFTGRAARLPAAEHRLTLPDVVRALGDAGHPAVSAEDFVPLPCSHPLCFSLAFYLMVEGGAPVSLNRLAPADGFLDSVANRVFYGLDPEEHERLKEMIYRLWSAPAGTIPDSAAVLATLRRLLRELSAAGRPFDPRWAFSVAERRVKSIFIHAFQDAATFDLARARRCCQAYPQVDGRLLPVCVRNVLGKRPSSTAEDHDA